MLGQVRKAYDDYLFTKSKYQKMYNYYKGKTDTMINYKNTDRSNLKVSVNYIKKFIKEEISYSIGNDINYISKSGDNEIIDIISKNFNHFSESHDINLLKNMLIFGEAYEVYYINQYNEFSAKVLSPLNSMPITDRFDNMVGFIHIFGENRYSRNNNLKTYIDYYTKDYIYHYDSSWMEIDKPTPNIFNEIPVAIARLSDECEYDTIYNDIKLLQDSFESVLSDACNEIADTRLAYLVAMNCSLGDDENLRLMKSKGVIELPNGANADLKWLVKNINDAFISGTLENIEDKIYQMTSHINHNESLSSNISGVTLRSRLISLEEKCKLNQKALADCIKKRLRLFFYLYGIKEGIEKDYRDIKIKFTANIPTDDLNTANIINQLRDVISHETALSLLSFIENPKNELDKYNSENENLDEGKSLLDL